MASLGGSYVLQNLALLAAAIAYTSPRRLPTSYSFLGVAALSSSHARELKPQLERANQKNLAILARFFAQIAMYILDASSRPTLARPRESWPPPRAHSTDLHARNLAMKLETRNRQRANIARPNSLNDSSTMSYA